MLTGGLPVPSRLADAHVIDGDEFVS